MVLGTRYLMASAASILILLLVLGNTVDAERSRTRNGEQGTPKRKKGKV